MYVHTFFKILIVGRTALLSAAVSLQIWPLEVSRGLFGKKLLLNHQFLSLWGKISAQKESNLRHDDVNSYVHQRIPQPCSQCCFLVPFCAFCLVYAL